MALGTLDTFIVLDSGSAGLWWVSQQQGASWSPTELSPSSLSSALGKPKRMVPAKAAKGQGSGVLGQGTGGRVPCLHGICTLEMNTGRQIAEPGNSVSFRQDAVTTNGPIGTQSSYGRDGRV